MHKIMVVDDEVIISTHLEKRLKLMGYDVVGRASTGERSIEMAEYLHPDLILMDIAMPGELDGIDAAGRIRERMDIPVIFMTGYVDDQYVRRAKQVEPYGYIMKPFQEAEIRAAIEVALHRKEKERGIFRSMEQLRNIVDTIYDAVVSLDGAGKVIFWNRRAEDLFGYTDNEILGKNFTSLLSPAAKKYLEQILSGKPSEADYRDDRTGSGECRGRRKDGGEFALSLHPSVHRVQNERFITCVVRKECLPGSKTLPLHLCNMVNSEKIISICSYCSNIRDEAGEWRPLADYLAAKMDILFSHGICPSCMKSLFSNLTKGE